jgi:hypothetical protein
MVRKYFLTMPLSLLVQVSHCSGLFFTLLNQHQTSRELSKYKFFHLRLLFLFVQFAVSVCLQLPISSVAYSPPLTPTYLHLHTKRFLTLRSRALVARILCQEEDHDRLSFVPSIVCEKPAILLLPLPPLMFTLRIIVHFALISSTILSICS